MKLKTKTFQRWQSKTDITDLVLLHAIEEMEQGIIDADLGGNLVKKRIGLFGRGKRGGARTILATNHGDRWVFIFGFSKNDRENIGKAELRFLYGLAHSIVSATEDEILLAIKAGEFLELSNAEQK